MTKKRGPKNKGRGVDSDYRRGYQNGWKRGEIVTRKGKKGKKYPKRIPFSKRSEEYRKGYCAGVGVAKKFYKKKRK